MAWPGMSTDMAETMRALFRLGELSLAQYRLVRDGERGVTC